MKVFDLNSLFINNVQSMINIQKSLENNTNNINSNYYNYQNSYKEDEERRKINSDYISLWKPAAPISNSIYFDLLMMGFNNEMDIDKLVDIPPFNDKCVINPNNVLLVNRNGDCIMAITEDCEASCSIFNKILRHNSVPVQQKTVITSFPHNVSSKGVAPPSTFPTTTLNAIESRLNDITTSTLTDKIKEKYNVIYNFHKQQSQRYHNNLKNNIERLKNYFCKFQNDMNEDVEIDGNEIIFDIATRMFPQKILQVVHNKAMYSIHFKSQAKTKPILYEESNPNCVYVDNLGFVNLVNMCNDTCIVLKNCSVYLDNLIKRDIEGYVNKTSDNCSYSANGNEDDDSTRTFPHINIVTMPQKRKINTDNVVDLVGKKSNSFDHLAYLKASYCADANTFDNYNMKYGGTNDKNCLRSI